MEMVTILPDDGSYHRIAMMVDSGVLMSPTFARKLGQKLIAAAEEIEYQNRQKAFGNDR